MIEVYCPHCGAIIPYSVFCRQIAKTKYNRRILIEVIAREKVVTTGELARKYQEEAGKVISLRTLGNVLAEFRRQGLIETRLVSKGRYGSTTKISWIARCKKPKS